MRWENTSTSSAGGGTCPHRTAVTRLAPRAGTGGVGPPASASASTPQTLKRAGTQGRQLSLVREAGLEPAHSKAQEPKSCVSTNSTTPAVHISVIGGRTTPAQRPRHPARQPVENFDEDDAGSVILGA